MTYEEACAIVEVDAAFGCYVVHIVRLLDGSYDVDRHRAVPACVYCQESARWSHEYRTAPRAP